MGRRILGLLLGSALAAHSFAQPFDSSLFRQLHFRFIGPDGNRTIAVAGVPGDRNIAYVGAASGGIFKTEDAGVTWRPMKSFPAPLPGGLLPRGKLDKQPNKN